jgi:hypothetical protein
MTQYAKTTDGKIHVVWSVNKYTYGLIDESQWLDKHGAYNVNSISLKQYPADEIMVTDTNLSIVRNYGRGMDTLVDTPKHILKDAEDMHNTAYHQEITNMFDATLKAVHDYTPQPETVASVKDTLGLCNQPSDLEKQVKRLQVRSEKISKRINFMLEEYFPFIADTIGASDIKYKVQLELTLLEITSDLNAILHLIED